MDYCGYMDSATQTPTNTQFAMAARYRLAGESRNSKGRLVPMRFAMAAVVVREWAQANPAHPRAYFLAS